MGKGALALGALHPLSPIPSPAALGQKATHKLPGAASSLALLPTENLTGILKVSTEAWFSMESREGRRAPDGSGREGLGESWKVISATRQWAACGRSCGSGGCRRWTGAQIR